LPDQGGEGGALLRQLGFGRGGECQALGGVADGAVGLQPVEARGAGGVAC
jgi:hypothetical protein